MEVEERSESVLAQLAQLASRNWNSKKERTSISAPAAAWFSSSARASTRTPRCSRWRWPWLLLLEQLRRGALAATAKGLQARATDDDDDDAEAWCFFDRFRGFKRVSFYKIGDDCHTMRSMLSSARSGGLTRGVEGRATRMQMPRRRQHFQSTRLTLSSSFFFFCSRSLCLFSLLSQARW